MYSTDRAGRSTFLGGMVPFGCNDGESTWLERRIADVKEIKTSDTVEWRNAVPMTLSCEGARKQVLVTLNDRSQMNYAMLLGRNLLKGEFVVDVDRAE